MTTKVLVVDDHALFLAGLSAILAECITGVEITSLRTANEALSIISENNKFDLVVLDINLPDISGFEVMAILSKDFPLLPVVVLSGSEHTGDAKIAYEHGAVGFISKSEDNHVVVSAIEHVLEGGLYFPTSISNGLSSNHPQAQDRIIGRKNDTSFGEGAFHLTARQYQLLAYLVEGWTNKEIARVLNVTEATVKAHVTAVLKALNVKNRTRAAAAVHQLGIELSNIITLKHSGG